MEAATLTASTESLEGLKEEWDCLWGKSASKSIFSSWDWQDLWWNAFGDGAEPLVLAIRDDRELIGIAPLVKREDTIRFFGGVDVSDYLDFISLPGRERDVIEAVFDFLKHIQWQELDLHCLRQSSPSLSLVPEIATALGFSHNIEEEDVCPAIDLPSDWEDFVGSLSKKDRHELRRKIRRLEGENYSYYVAPPDTDTRALADTFLRLCSLSRHEKAVFLEDQQVEGFFRAIIDHFLPLGVLKVHMIEVDHKPVSAVICFDEEHETWLYNSGFDPAYSQLSVGLLLKAFCIKWSIEEGKRRYDFLRGREPYKYDLGGQDIPISRLRVSRAAGVPSDEDGAANREIV